MDYAKSLLAGAATVVLCGVPAGAQGPAGGAGSRGVDHTLVMLSHTNHTVYEVDPSSGRILHEFVAPDQAHEAAITPDGATIFASVPSAALVEIIDAGTFTEKGRIVTDFFKRTPLIRPGRRGGPPGPPITSASPHGMALTTDGSKLYIGTENADVSGVIVYDVKAGRVLKKIDLLLEGGHYLQIQPRTDKLYYPHRNDNRVVVIDTKTDRILKIIRVAGGPVGVAFAPNGEVWFHEDGDGSVTVVDSAKDEVIKVIQTGAKGAGRMAVSPDGRYAASTHSDSQDVAIIDTATKELIANVKIGKGPGFPLFSPDSTKLYIMESGEGDLVVVDVRTLAVTARYKVGTDPFGGGVRMAGAAANR
ncbi:MAG: YncE family protein [Acidobacteria bacterium]|nr:YncE family protein [Acidobacteriota bacterium]